jgi:hypothetical protein
MPIQVRWLVGALTAALLLASAIAYTRLRPRRPAAAARPVHELVVAELVDALARSVEGGRGDGIIASREHARRIEDALRARGLPVVSGTLQQGSSGRDAARAIARSLGDAGLRALAGRLQMSLARTRQAAPASKAVPEAAGASREPRMASPQEEREPKPIARWPADGDARDTVGTSHGKLMRGASFTDAGFGWSFMLTRPDQLIDLGNVPVLRFSRAPFTLSAWVWFAARMGQRSSIVSKMSELGDDGWWLGKLADDVFGFCLGNGGGDGCAAGAPTSLRSRTVAVADRWYHVVLVRGAKEMSLFIDGEPEDAKPLPAFVDTHRVNMVLGGGFVGMIDEVVVFDRELSGRTIKALARVDVDAGGNATQTVAGETGGPRTPAAEAFFRAPDTPPAARKPAADSPEAASTVRPRTRGLPGTVLSIPPDETPPTLMLVPGMSLLVGPGGRGDAGASTAGTAGASASSDGETATANPPSEALSPPPATVPPDSP